MKTKPFNLEEFMAGKPAVMRDGSQVKFVMYLPDLDLMDYPVKVRDKHGLTIRYNTKGQLLNGEETSMDLLLVEEAP